MRTIVIGDVHGCFEEMYRLVEKLQPSFQDNLVFLGDLIDKGPRPFECVQFARHLGAMTIMGNHEDRALRWLNHEKNRIATGKANPMKVPPARTAEWSSLSAENVAYLSTAPVSLDLGSGFLAVHGGLLPGIPLEKQKPGNVMRLRYVTKEGKFAPLDPGLAAPEGSVDWQNMYDGPHSLVVGHAVHSLDFPRVDRYADGREVWSIDTGCVYGGRLTALVVETREVIQVKAERAYASWNGNGEE